MPKTDEWCHDLLVKINKVVAQHEQLKKHLDAMDMDRNGDYAIPHMARMEKRINKIMRG